MTDCLDRSANAHAAKCELASEVLRSSERLRLQVTGWSMLPSVWPGDTLIIERAKAGSVSEGDIVLFGRDRRLFAHRVIRVMGDARFQTRGDAMPSADPIIDNHELLGKVLRIERKGKSFVPKCRVGVAGRIVAGLVLSSAVATRVMVALHDGFQSLQFRTS